MLRTKTQLINLILLTLLVFPFISSYASESIKIGVAGAHSGDLASYGLPTVNAARLVINRVNEQGGIKGHLLELLVEDDVCKPEIATNTATKLVTQGVKIVIGHICSGATKAALPIYKEANVLVISPSATNPELTQRGAYPNFFRTIAPDDAQAKTATNFVLNTLNLKKIAIIHDKGDYGKGLAEFSKKFIEKSGKAEITLFEGVTPGAVDYSAVVQKVRRFKADAVIFGGYHPEASKIVSQMRKKRMKTPFISFDGIKDETFIKVAGKYAENTYATGPADTSTNPINKDYRTAHKKAYGEEAGAFFNNAIAATLTIVNGLRIAGSSDFDQLSTALRTSKTETPLGTIHFDEHGDSTGIGFSVYQVQNDEYVQVD